MRTAQAFEKLAMSAGPKMSKEVVHFCTLRSGRLLSILEREPSSMRSTTQIAPNPKASPIAPPGIAVFCSTHEQPKAMAMMPTALRGGQIFGNDTSSAAVVRAPSLACQNEGKA